MTRPFFLNFHGIGEPHNGVDQSERPYWISEAFFRQIVASVHARPDAHRIHWTFDDGNRSDLTIGAPVLAAHGCTGSFFVLTGRLQHDHYLSVPDIQQLLNSGMTVGLHGCDHVDWRTISSEQLRNETIDARETLAAAVGRPIDAVAIPFGAYNRRVIQHLKQCGFTSIYTSDGGPAAAGARIIARTSIRSDMALADIHHLIDDQIPAARKARRFVSASLRRHLI